MLTIKQAAEQTGKSELTIRRLIKQTLADNPKAEGRLVGRNAKGAYLVSEKLLATTYSSPTAQDEDIPVTAPQASLTADTAVITLLQDTVNLLKDQLSVKDQQIADLTKAQERSDVLLKDIQARLAIPSKVDGLVSHPGNIVMPHGQAVVTEATATVSSKPKRRGLFGRRKG